MAEPFFGWQTIYGVDGEQREAWMDGDTTGAYVGTEAKTRLAFKKEPTAPPAYNNCTCDCHLGSGKIHFVACCSPATATEGSGE